MVMASKLFLPNITCIFRLFVWYNIINQMKEANILTALIEKEEKRNKHMIMQYLNELDTLPKGTLKSKNINGKVYYYLVFRNGNKIVSKYVGKDEMQIISIKEQLLRRKQIKEILKKLLKEKEQIQKVEALL